MPRGVRSLVVGLALFLSLGSVSGLPAAQPAFGEPQRAPSSGATQGPVAAETPAAQFRSAVSRVRVDLIVTDEDGAFVADLRPGEIELLEDGVPQPVLGLTLVDFSRSHVEDLTADEEPRPAGATVDLNADVLSSTSDVPPPAPPGGRFGAMVFVIDGRNLEPRARRRFAQGWQELLDETDSFVFPRAAYAIDYLGRLRELSPLTHDVDVLRDVPTALLEAPWFDRGGVDPTSPFDSRRAEQRRNDQETHSDDLYALQPDDEIPEYEELSQGIHTFELLGELAELLGRRPGRKALVWVSPGIDLREYTIGTYKVPVFVNAFFQYDMRTAVAQQALHETANTANVSIYGVDPTLSTRSTMRMNETVGFAEMELPPTREPLTEVEGYDPLEVARAADDILRDALRITSSATGGQAYPYFGPSVADAIRRIEADNRRFYLLTYATPAPLADGRYHSIRVRVNRPGVEVRARPGYIDRVSDESERYEIAAALALPGESESLPVDFGAFRMLGSDGVWSLALHAMAHGAPGVGTLAFHAQAVRDGFIVDQIDREIRPRSGGPQTAREPVAFTVPWTLGPGNYELRAGFRQAATSLAGTGRLRIVVPARCEGWCASDLAPMVSTEGGPVPTLAGGLPADDPVGLFVQVFGGEEPFLRGEILAEDGSSLVAYIEPTELTLGADGLHSMIVPIPGGLEPGTYVLDARVCDPPAVRHRSYRIELRVQ